MAIVYFDRIDDVNGRLRYRFGSDVDDMTRVLLLDDAEKTSEPVDGNPDQEFIRAHLRIMRMHRERGEWPERGMSVS